ncbi:MAG TPA: argininosuccinate synthase [Anaerolineae bacterium]|nr:argininosuccinate synthase [Anaerolineae bacterium]
MKHNIRKVVLAYSGGLDTSVIVPWLVENYDCEVVAFIADIGQGDDMEYVADKAVKSGASKAVVEDLKHEFVTEYIYPTMRAGAVYEGKYLLGTSMARPVIAKHQVRTALAENADAVAHGCTGKGNDQVRFELTYKAFAPQLQVIAPWREWNIKGRDDALAYAKAHNVPVSQTAAKIYSRDGNLWHLSHEGGELEDPWNEPNEDMFQLSVSPEQAPDEPTYIELEFKQGTPIALDGEELEPVTLIAKLNRIGGENGIGRVDLVENRLVGMKSHGVYETPGGTLLYTAHRELEHLTLDRETLHYKDLLAQKYAELVYNGLWFTPLREALDAFVTKTQERVTGTVKLKLYKGNVIVAGRKSPYSLYQESVVTFMRDEVFNQAHADGFINLFGLPITVRSMVNQGILGKLEFGD